MDMAASAFVVPRSDIPSSRVLRLPHSTQLASRPLLSVDVSQQALASSAPSSTLRFALAVAVTAIGVSRRRTGARARARHSVRNASGDAQPDVLLDLDPGWLARGPGGAGAVNFPFPHWLWQHGIARFEAAKLADACAIPRKELADAWELHHACGYISHANIEDERVFPALLSVEGGAAAVAQLTAHHSDLDALATEITHSLHVGVDEEDIRVLMCRWSALLVEHMDLEESLILPLVANMPDGARDELGSALKKGMRKVPGSKMILCLFRDISATDKAAGVQYEKSFPGFLRYVLIPTLTRIDKQYAEHRRIFGKLASAR